MTRCRWAASPLTCAVGLRRRHQQAAAWVAAQQLQGALHQGKRLAGACGRRRASGVGSEWAMVEEGRGVMEPARMQGRPA